MEVRRLDFSSIDEQVRVYRLSFDSVETGKNTKDRWIKKHFSNPLHESYIFGVYDGDSLVSINAYMPMRMTFDNRTVNVVQSCESGTIPSHRGKGIWSMVVKYAIDYFKNEGIYDFLIGFPNYENSYWGFKKMNWNTDAEIENHVFIANGCLFKKTIGKNLPIPSRLLEFQHLFLKRVSRRRLSVGQFESGISEKDCFNLVEDEAFFSWKADYRKLEGFGLYDAAGNMYVSCSYYPDTYNGQKILVIASVSFGKNTNRGKAFGECVRSLVANHKDVAFLRIWTMRGSMLFDAVCRNGFIKSRHKNPFITYCLKTDVVSEDEMRDCTLWKDLCFIYLD